MEKSLKGTRTLENLMKAFAGESQARNRYTFYADKAVEEGFMQISAIFLETADNERIHAQIFYEHIIHGLQGEEFPVALELNAAYPVALGTTQENLVAAAMGENEEWSVLYPAFAEVAKEEGFPQIAASFRMIVGVEQDHEERYLKLAQNVKDGQVFKKESKTAWKCMACGYIHEAEEAPKACPVCKRPQAFFKRYCENY